MPLFSYVPLLRHVGFRPLMRYPWAAVGRTRRIQGWKLHLSSVQSEAVRLLDAVLPILHAARVSFKVAEHDRVLALLNEGEFGPTQIGKFLTIYPRSDGEARVLAERLIDRTQPFRGPQIVSDLHLGSVVFARYGSFSPVVTRDRLGYRVPMIEGPSGNLMPDRYTVPFAPPEHVSNPFADLIRPAAPRAVERPAARRMIGGYLVLQPIRLRPWGGALLAIDLRAQQHVALKVLKFGRAHCLSDAEGRDIRDRLRWQADLHARLAAGIPVPSADPYFEDNGYGYAAFQHLDGDSFETLVTARPAHRPWHHLPPRMAQRLLRIATAGIGAVRRLHDAGYIHRDLGPANVFVTTHDRVHLLDLEIAHPIGSSQPPFGLGTAGFMSPQQFAREAPAIADDVFSVGSLLAFMLTRLDPRRVVFAGDRARGQRLERLAAGAPPALVDVVCRCLEDERDARPDLSEVEAVVAEAAETVSTDRAVRTRAARSRHDDFLLDRQIHEVLRLGQQGLLDDARHTNGLWRSARAAHAGRAAGGYEIERHANRGVAGIVYLLARLHRLEVTGPGAGSAVRRAAAWLLKSEPPASERLPGLHFGEAGVAVALAEAVAAGYLRRGRRLSAFLARSLAGALDWPDITHGAAGQGIAALACAERLADASLARHADRCVDFLLSTQSRDGCWTLPPGIDGLSGQTLTGFAHGAAGVVFFLAEYDRRACRRHDVSASIRRGVAWLVDQANPAANGTRLEWSYGTHTRERWHWWCHGGPGIALTFLKLYEYSRRERYACLAKQALAAHPPEIRYANLTQCHGLSGLAEIYLEAARVLGDDVWRMRARAIAAELVALARPESRGISWIAEDPNLSSADLMVGYGGVLHFLSRLIRTGAAHGFPLLLDPAA